MNDPGGEDKKTAFFGGSFDPPHLGHLAIARAARDALKLDRVLFAPVGAQPLKPAGSSAMFADRLAMTELAIQDDPGFEISLLDAPSAAGTPNYTLESLQQLRTQLGPRGKLLCLMGADSFVGLRKWRGASAIPLTAALIVASRPGQLLDDLRASLPEGLAFESDPCWNAAPAAGDPPQALVECRVRNQAGQAMPFYVLPGLDVEISASEVRSRFRESPSPASKPGWAPLVPPAVARYIEQHRLYR